jgi:hypothetical protein
MLVVLAPVLPVLSVMASQLPTRILSRAWAVGVLLAGLLVYAVGEQEYPAWQGGPRRSRSGGVRDDAG